MLSIQEEYQKIKDMWYLLDDLYFLVQDIQQLLDAAAQAGKAATTQDWIKLFDSSYADLRAIADLMTVFENLEMLQWELSRIRDISETSTFQNVLDNFYALAVDDAVLILGAYQFVKDQAAKAGSGSEAATAALIAKDLVDQITAPLCRYLGATVDTATGYVVLDGAGVIATLQNMIQSFPPKSSAGLTLKPVLMFEPFLWTWNTWFDISFDYLEFGTTRYCIRRGMCATIPSVTMRNKAFTIPMPNEHVPGFAFMMSLLQ